MSDLSVEFVAPEETGSTLALIGWAVDEAIRESFGMVLKDILLLRCATGEWGLFVARVDGEYAGLLVMAVNGWRDGTYANKVLCHTRGLMAARFPILKVLFAAGEWWARANGATHIHFFTARKGAERVAPKLGYEPRFTEWVRELK